MPILSFDTTTKVASVAVVQGTAVLCEVSLGHVQNHAARLLPVVDFALEQANVKRPDIKQIAVGAGPGSFTGLRIGLSLAKGLAEGLGVPLVLLSTLEVLANELCFFSGVVIPLLDAQRQEYYAAAFRSGQGVSTRLSPDMLIKKEDFAAWAHSFGSPVLLTGEAAPLPGVASEFFVAPNFLAAPRAAIVGILSQGRMPTDPKYALPNYIRTSSAQAKKEVVS